MNIRPVVVIPTYNNAGTIVSVINDVKKYCGDIVVVNDGSTDGTASLLRNVDNIGLISFDKNQGKGAALQAAFKYCNDKKFSHAITFDADGQHLGIDIPVLIDKINNEPETLWIGDRTITVKDGVEQPPRSRFGRRFGAFWFQFYTGVFIRDTQCGLRAYPLEAISTLECYSPRYEYEIEILISASWNNIAVKSVPVHLLYMTKEERVSHFRPFIDFMRISKVNSRAAMIRLFLPKNVRMVGELSIRAKLKAFVVHELKAHTTPKRAAASLAIGVLVGLSPFHGFHMLILIAASMLLKFNRPLSFLGVSISSAPLMPLCIIAAYYAGVISIPLDWITPYGAMIDKWIPQKWIEIIQPYIPVADFGIGFMQWFFGSFVIGVVGGFLTYFLSLPVCKKLLVKK
jgi:glycosyltransferase involved in cell wall biosynthesis